jgi:cation:H+ antiporter
VAAIVWGAETFAEHLAAASVRLGVSTFALAVLLAGAEPEELATAVVSSLRGAPAVALGDVIGANVTICLVALGVGALVAPVPFDRSVRRYALAGLPAAGLAVAAAWDGSVGRTEGAVLVAAYLAYVAAIWVLERRPPALGETGELSEAREAPTAGRTGRDVALVLAGVGAMAGGATVLVEGVTRLSEAEGTRSRLGIVVVGFATAFELVVLAWSSARRGISSAVVAAVVGSFAYNTTMTLGAGALASPLVVRDPGLLRWPWLAMVAALGLVLALGWRHRRLGRSQGMALLACYPVFVAAVLLTG